MPTLPRLAAFAVAAVLSVPVALPAAAADLDAHPELEKHKKKGAREDERKPEDRRGAQARGRHHKKKKGPQYKGPFRKRQYPVSERLRPMVLPEGMGEGGLELGYAREPLLDFPGAALEDRIGLGATFGYGLSDTIEVGATTGLDLAPQLGWNGQIAPYGRWLAVDGRRFDFAPGASVPLTLQGQGTPVSAIVNLSGRYLVSDKVFLTFGDDAVQVGISPQLGLAVQANGGLGWQVDPKWLLSADTTVASATVIGPTTGVSGLWDTLAVRGGVQYSPSRYWDVGARVGVTDTFATPDPARVTVGAFGRYRF